MTDAERIADEQVRFASNVGCGVLLILTGLLWPMYGWFLWVGLGSSYWLIPVVLVGIGAARFLYGIAVIVRAKRRR